MVEALLCPGNAAKIKLYPSLKEKPVVESKGAKEENILTAEHKMWDWYNM